MDMVAALVIVAGYTAQPAIRQAPCDPFSACRIGLAAAVIRFTRGNLWFNRGFLP
jgi:hypothetical protein